MLNWEAALDGVVNVHVDSHLRDVLVAGRRLRVKFGVDPSAPDLHLGHAVVLDRLRRFQDLGHLAVLIIGDYTARIGDPSGRSATRRPLEPEAVAANAATYLDQVFKILDRDRCEVRHQSEWFDSMDLAGVLRLAGRATVAQLLQRDDFSKRSSAGDPIGLHELLYPLMQGYDSIAVRSDLELGGTDQLYNLLFARDLMRESGLEPQDILTMPILEGLDGKLKMGKSLNNYVGLTDPPVEMYGKLMSVPDALITRYMSLGGGFTPGAVAEAERRLADGENPRDLKAELAAAVVVRFHGAGAAAPAADAFSSQFRRGEVPDGVPTMALAVLEAGLPVAAVLQRMGFASSASEARRLVAQRGVRRNGIQLDDPNEVLTMEAGDLWQVGRRRFLRLVAGD
ncbi:MAG: tyrosine--tRNA ligase [Candidatus Dormibacteria bacterium]